MSGNLAATPALGLLGRLHLFLYPGFQRRLFFAIRGMPPQPDAPTSAWFNIFQEFNSACLRELPNRLATVVYSTESALSWRLGLCGSIEASTSVHAIPLTLQCSGQGMWPPPVHPKADTQLARAWPTARTMKSFSGDDSRIDAVARVGSCQAAPLLQDFLLSLIHI